MVKPYLNQVGGKVENDVNMFTGGLNVYGDKAFIDANHMPYVMNMTMKNPPRMETRNQRVTLANYLEDKQYPEDPTSVSPIIDMWTYNEYQFYVLVREYDRVNIVEYRRPFNNGFYAQNYEVTPIATIEDEPNYYFTSVKISNNDYLYITGLTFKYKIWLNRSDNPLREWRWRINDGYYGIPCWHKGRLFFADPATNIVTHSAWLDPDNFEDEPIYALIEQVPTSSSVNLKKEYVYLNDGGAVYIVYRYNTNTNQWEQTGTMPKEDISLDDNGMSLPDYSSIAGDFPITNARGEVVSLKSFDDKMIMFCRHSIHALYGSNPMLGGENQFQQVDISNNLGALLDRCIAIGGGRLFFLGDDNEVYEYTGSALNIITRPGTTRNSTISVGGISGLIEARDVSNGTPQDKGNRTSKFVATAEKLYINIWNRKRTADEKLLFVFDIYNRLWWCEDGEFNTIGNFRDYNNQIFLARDRDILINNQDTKENEDIYGDEVYDFDTNSMKKIPIQYEFHTRVYGADGLDMRKSITEVWLQARAEANVYLNDIWSSQDYWQLPAELHSNLLKIGTLKYEIQQPVQQTKYRPETYEQQVCYVEKMYGERLNAFQIVVKGSGKSSFWLMKRVWRAR